MKYPSHTPSSSSNETNSSERWFFRSLLGLLGLVLLARLTLLLAGGALAFPDEDRYLESIKAAQLLLAGDPEGAALHLANTQGRPADALLRLPVAFVQVFWQQLGGPHPEAPLSLLLPQLMNYLVLVGNVLLLYLLGLRWLPKTSALTGCLLYAALVSSNLYLRHLLPYDLALLVLLVALVILTRNSRPVTVSGTRQLGLLTGVLGWLVVAIYPGYYFAPVLVGLFLLAHLPSPRWLQGILWAVVGALFVILLLELITRYGHISYLRSLQTLGPSIIQGDFSEGFSFSGRYLWQIEGVSGIALVLLALPGMALLSRTRTTETRPMLRALAWGPLGLWLLHASLAYFAHKFVFYGRILHFFVPFLVLYAVSALAWLPPVGRRVSQALVVGSTLFGFCHFLHAYGGLAYPRDVLAKLAVQPIDHLTYMNEGGLGHSWDFSPPPGLARPAAVPSSLLLVNFTYPYPMPLTGCAAVAAPSGGHLLYAGPHFLTFPAYAFEGFTPAERQHLRSCNFQCRVYQR
ncbi:hypothetical protein [Hymenobacter wooponensis]|uniref:Glycosyltransferase RgtA/B/C/D-like domain-containing protein n=1 Tax=Hymenobacter wooponensis TaxID=1525360 RepID=A0A4Z0MJQ0_9BACT|nr:hypothetical protein [Hymenobacter wooponensis]TGD79726.1 hypothetical protein EU557_16040 [Hymenobacter wooponensis]